MADVLEDLKVAIKNEKLVIGTETVMKGIRDKSLKRVLVSSNAPEDVKEDIAKYAGLSDIPVDHLEMNNEELGTFCKKKYHISVLGLN